MKDSSLSRVGIYPGTFDPITHGHHDIIRRALHVVDRLIIAVAQDTGKDTIFDLETRTALIREDLKLLGDKAARVEVHGFEGLLVHFAEKHNTRLLIRGLRAVSDFEYEFQMACMNARLNPRMETIFLTASETTHFVSSRLIKQIASLGGDISAFVSPAVAKTLRDYYSSHA